MTISRYFNYAAASLFAVSLFGCQTMNNAPPANDKTLSTPTTLSVSPELLARYEWHLDSAVANHYDAQGKLTDREPISDFYHPDYPISFEISYDPDRPVSFEVFNQSKNESIYFSSNCNASSAPYVLSKDNTLEVGMIISTMMGCGTTGNRIETALFNFMRSSTSTLTLSYQSKTQHHKNSSADDYPRYNLLQTMTTGETLLWQNVPKKALNTPADNNDNK
ncbi:META domain-containing protein [Psychrobacter aestuarii]|uniref:DUF306 domain-containing protein n=1 Tax=Psychrobacter aestuarii TaxID=556327 RepID=A0ABN0VLV2_9GAMM|nr:META domain-containing protein [Psychrobacter aestuarii]